MAGPTRPPESPRIMHARLAIYYAGTDGLLCVGNCQHRANHLWDLLLLGARLCGARRLCSRSSRRSPARRLSRRSRAARRGAPPATRPARPRPRRAPLASNAAVPPPAAATAPSAATPERVTILYPNQGANQTATWLAQEAGLYARYGLDASVEVVEGRPTVMQALAAGNAQVAVVGTTASISAGLRGLDVVLVATAQPGLLYTRWTAGIDRVDDLRGKRVASGPLTSDPDFALRLLLGRLDLRYNEDVAVLHVDAGGEPARIAAVVGGS